MVMPRILPSDEPTTCLDRRGLEKRLAKERGSGFEKVFRYPVGFSEAAAAGLTPIALTA